MPLITNCWGCGDRWPVYHNEYSSGSLSKPKQLLFERILRLREYNVHIYRTFCGNNLMKVASLNNIRRPTTCGHQDIVARVTSIRQKVLHDAFTSLHVCVTLKWQIRTRSLRLFVVTSPLLHINMYQCRSTYITRNITVIQVHAIIIRPLQLL